MRGTLVELERAALAGLLNPVFFDHYAFASEMRQWPVPAIERFSEHLEEIGKVAFEAIYRSEAGARRFEAQRNRDRALKSCASMFMSCSCSKTATGLTAAPGIADALNQVGLILCGVGALELFDLLSSNITIWRANKERRRRLAQSERVYGQLERMAREILGSQRGRGMQIWRAGVQLTRR